VPFVEKTRITSVAEIVRPYDNPIVSFPFTVALNTMYWLVASAAPPGATLIRNVSAVADWFEIVIVLTIVLVDAGTVYKFVSVAAAGAA